MSDKLYILQKPLPNVTVGELFKWDMNSNMYATVRKDKFGRITYYEKDLVENSDWFLPEQPEVENKEWKVVEEIKICKDGYWDGFSKEIYSVKRLSDNEVFSVGDEVEYRSGDDKDWNTVWHGKINSIKIASSDKSKIEFEIDDNHEWKENHYPHKFIENIRHILHKQENKDVFTWDGTEEGFLKYLIQQKEDYCKRQDFATASEWRTIEKLYRSHLKIKNAEKHEGTYISLSDIVEQYLKSEQSKQPIKPDRRIKVSIEDWSADMMGVVMYFTDKISQEQKPLIKQTLEAVLNNDLAYPIGRLVEELEKDKSEGSYYHSWQANIAVAFQDVYREELGDSPKMRMFIHEISNTAAKRFLDLLCYHPIPETSINSLNTNTKTSKHWT